MADNNLKLMLAVAHEITSIYDLQVPASLEYPGFICIAEQNVNDDTDGSQCYWACGPSDDPNEPHVWTGQLMTDNGNNVDDMTFAILVESDDPKAIASALYCHGIGELYVGGGGCSESDCPRLRYQEVHPR